MSVGAISVTFSSSNGGCQVLLVIFLVNLFLLKKKFFSIRDPPPPPKCTQLAPRKNNFGQKQNATEGENGDHFEV